MWQSSRCRPAGRALCRRPTYRETDWVLRIHPPRARLIRGFERMRGLGLPMQRDENPLHVPVDAALTHLIRNGLDERVVPAFRLRRDLNGHRHLGFADDAPVRANAWR